MYSSLVSSKVMPLFSLIVTITHTHTYTCTLTHVCILLNITCSVGIVLAVPVIRADPLIIEIPTISSSFDNSAQSMSQFLFKLFVFLIFRFLFASLVYFFFGLFLFCLSGSFFILDINLLSEYFSHFVGCLLFR